MRTLLWGAKVTVQAGDALWLLDEVAALGRSISRIAQRFGGDVTRIVGGATVKKYSELRPWWNWGKRVGGYEDNLTIFMSAAVLSSPDEGERAFVHEFGHFFDEKQGLIDGFLEQTGGLAIGLEFNKRKPAAALLYHAGGLPYNGYAGSSPYEDLAVSFEEYVYSNWSPSSTYITPMDVNRYMFFEQFRE